MQNFMLSVFMAPSLALASVTTGIDPALMDKSVDPCTDFYQYACGTWLKNTKLPDDRPKWNRGFDEVDHRNEKMLLKILESYQKGVPTPPSAYARQLGDIYAACMDTEQIEKTALEDFRAFARPILELKKKEDLSPLLADLHLKGVHALFAFIPEEDLKNPSEKIMTADQGGMGLPTREYYVSDSSDMAGLREAYRAFAETALSKAGYDETSAKEKSSSVLALEKQLAVASLLPVERRDPNKLHHRLERKGLIALAPRFGWMSYFKALGVAGNDKINVAVPDYFKSLDETIVRAPLEDLKAYLLVRFFATSVGAMDKESLNANFILMSKFYGLRSLPARSRLCLMEVTQNMGDALGKSFVDVAFSEEAKAETLDMVKRLQEEMRLTLENAAWMDPKTKSFALLKLKHQKVYMGYPDRWRNYRGLSVSRKSMLANRLKAAVFNRKHELNKLGKPVDRADWTGPATEVNAYNFISQNKIRFPAGILQSPNFALNRSDTLNYGALGTVVGHEITHGYDDQGRLFDERGAVRAWWTPKTGEEFDRRAACIVKQFDEYVVDGSLHVNGKMVQGEAIGDLGGMKLALAALKRKQNGKGESVGGHTVDQLFFLSLAQSWCTKASPEFEKFQTNTDAHPLDRFRVNGTVRNVPQFAEAFSCKTGAPLAPKERCVVW